MTNKNETATLEGVGSTGVLGGKIQAAIESLARILAKFDGSENHKQIRMLRKRVLKKLLKEAADLTPNGKGEALPTTDKETKR